MKRHDDRTEAFEAHRPRLIGLGYRMLGTVAEAEDLVQETYLRWHRSAQRRRCANRAPGSAPPWHGCASTRCARVNRAAKTMSVPGCRNRGSRPNPRTTTRHANSNSPTIFPSPFCCCWSASDRTSARHFCCTTSSKPATTTSHHRSANRNPPCGSSFRARGHELLKIDAAFRRHAPSSWSCARRFKQALVAKNPSALIVAVQARCDTRIRRRRQSACRAAADLRRRESRALLHGCHEGPRPGRIHVRGMLDQQRAGNSDQRSERRGFCHAVDRSRRRPHSHRLLDPQSGQARPDRASSRKTHPEH